MWLDNCSNTMRGKGTKERNKAERTSSWVGTAGSNSADGEKKLWNCNLQGINNREEASQVEESACITINCFSEAILA